MIRPHHGGNLAWAAQLAGCPPSLLTDFSASINPLGPPDSAIAAIQASIPDLRAYPDPNYGALRQALSQFHQLLPEWILPGNGSAELLTWASRELAELTTTSLITPAFGDYGRSLKAFDAHIAAFPLDLTCNPSRDGQSALDAIATSCPPGDPSGHSAQGLLINNPHNPTGILFSRSSLIPCLKQFDLVVVDEAFMDFLPPDQQQSLIDLVPQYPNLVILRSLTKFYSLPGLRIGYAIAHPDRLQRWQTWRDPWSVNTLAAAATVAALQDTSFQQQTWNWLASARSPLWEGLKALPGLRPYPGSVNFLLVESTSSVTQLQQRLLQQHRILIRDCLSFPELGDRYFRIAIRTESENQRLLDSLTQLLPLE